MGGGVMGEEVGWGGDDRTAFLVLLRAGLFVVKVVSLVGLGL